MLGGLRLRQPSLCELWLAYASKTDEARQSKAVLRSLGEGGLVQHMYFLELPNGLIKNNHAPAINILAQSKRTASYSSQS